MINRRPRGDVAATSPSAPIRGRGDLAATSPRRPRPGDRAATARRLLRATNPTSRRPRQATARRRRGDFSGCLGPPPPTSPLGLVKFCCSELSFDTLLMEIGCVCQKMRCLEIVSFSDKVRHIRLFSLNSCPMQ